MRYYRGIRFDLFTDMDAALKKVVYARQEVEESKAAIREAGRAVQAYNRAYPKDGSKVEAFRTLEEAHTKLEQARLLLITAQMQINK